MQPNHVALIDTTPAAIVRSTQAEYADRVDVASFVGEFLEAAGIAGFAMPV